MQSSEIVIDVSNKSRSSSSSGSIRSTKSDSCSEDILNDEETNSTNSLTNDNISNHFISCVEVEITNNNNNNNGGKDDVFVVLEADISDDISGEPNQTDRTAVSEGESNQPVRSDDVSGESIKSFSSTNSSIFSPEFLSNNDQFSMDGNMNISNMVDLQNLLSKIIENMDDLQIQLDIEKAKNDLLKNKLENNINKLSKKYKDLNKYTTSEINDIVDEMYSYDCRLIRLEQYSRRESLVISGIPDNVPQNELETLVLNILRTIGVQTISSYEVCACHRLAKKRGDKYAARTIIKFTNRKIVEFCIENRDRLLKVKPYKMNLRFYHSLCDANEDILFQCKQLQKYGVIENYYLRNGSIKIIRKDNNNPYKITHPDILYNLFYKDYYDHDEIYLT